MGDLGLCPRLRRLSAARRPRRRPARPAADLHGRPRPLHARLSALRFRLERDVADRRTCRAGPGRGHAVAGRALDPDAHVRRRSRAQHRTRGVGRRRRLRRRGRGAARRHRHRPAQLGMDLPRQRAHRCRRPDPVAALAGREPRRAGDELRRHGRLPRHLGPRAPRARHHAGPELGLGLRTHHRALRRVGGAAARLPRLGVAGTRAADALRDLALPHAHGGERRGLHPGDGAVRDVPDADAVHAAGARLLRHEDRRRLPRGRGDDRAVGECRRGGRKPGGCEARPHLRHGASHRRPRLLHTGLRGRLLLGRPLPRLPDHRTGHAILLRADHDRGGRGHDARGRRPRLGPDQHVAADRRRARHRPPLHHRHLRGRRPPGGRDGVAAGVRRRLPRRVLGGSGNRARGRARVGLRRTGQRPRAGPGAAAAQAAA